MSWNTKILAMFFKRYKQIIGDLPYPLRELEKIFIKIEKGQKEYYIFYGLVLTYSAVYPLVYYGYYKQTLFSSY